MSNSPDKKRHDSRMVHSSDRKNNNINSGKGRLQINQNLGISRACSALVF